MGKASRRRKVKKAPSTIFPGGEVAQACYQATGKRGALVLRPGLPPLWIDEIEGAIGWQVENYDPATQYVAVLAKDEWLFGTIEGITDPNQNAAVRVHEARASLTDFVASMLE